MLKHSQNWLKRTVTSSSLLFKTKNSLKSSGILLKPTLPQWSARANLMIVSKVSLSATIRSRINSSTMSTISLNHWKLVSKNISHSVPWPHTCTIKTKDALSCLKIRIGSLLSLSKTRQCAFYTIRKWRMRPCCDTVMTSSLWLVTCAKWIKRILCNSSSKSKFLMSMCSVFMTFARRLMVLLHKLS